MSSLARSHVSRFGTFGLLVVVLAAIAAIPVSATDDNISGAVVPTGGSAIRGNLDGTNNPDDVYKVALNEGDTVSIRLSGAPGTDFDLYLYPPSAKDIWRNVEVAWSENPGTSGESISYVVPATGTYYVDVATWDTAGSYTLKITSPSRISIDADTSLVRYGQSGKISGTVSPAHLGGTVKLLQRPASSDEYTTAATANVGTGGKYEFTVSPSQKTTYQASWAGDVDHESATSGTVEISVRSTISFSTSASQVSRGNSCILSGRVNPGHSGQRATIQRKLSRGWSNLRTVTLDSHSRFSWSYTPPANGTYDLRAIFDGDDSHESATSSQVRVNVSQPPPS